MKKTNGSYQITPGETISGRDYADFMEIVIKSRNDPIYFIEEVLGFPGPDEFGNRRHLYPVQEHIIRTFYRHKYDPKYEPYKKMVYISGQRCLRGDSLILTSNGGFLIEDLYPKNVKKEKNKLVELENIDVFNGEIFTKPSGIIYAGKKHVYELTTEYGFVFRSSIDHKFLVFNGSEFKWKPLKDIDTSTDYLEFYINTHQEGTNLISDESKLKIKNFINQNKTNYTLPIFVNKDISILMGMLIADGSITSKGSIKFTKADDSLINAYIDIIKNNFNIECGIYKKSNSSNKSSSIEFYNEQVRNFLFVIGLDYKKSDTKYIPASIRTGTKENKCAFLSGYFSCDGNVQESKSGDGSKCRITATTVSKRLAYEIQQMLLELGILSSISIGNSVEFNSRVTRENKAYTLNVFGSEINKFCNIIKFISEEKYNMSISVCNSQNSKKSKEKCVPVSVELIENNFEKSRDFYNILHGNTHTISVSKIIKNYIPGKSEVIDRIIDPNRIYLKVKSIENLQIYSDMYDLCVPDGNCYVANGMLTHNSGKTAIASTILAYEFFETISWQNPAKHFGLMTGKSGKGATIALTCVATNKNQANYGVFTNMKNLMEENEWFNTWFPDLTYNNEIIESRSKNTIAQILAPKSSTASGYTSKCIIADELDFYIESETMLDVNKVYDKLCNSTDTFKREGKIVAISSLNTFNGIMMREYNSTLREARKKNPMSIGFNYKTWEVNPNLSKEYLLESCGGNYTKFLKDYANNPSASAGVQFPEGINLNREMHNVLYEDLDTLSPDLKNHQRVLSLDPAWKHDMFGMACGYRTGDVITIDGARGFSKDDYETEEAYLKPSDIRNFIDSIVGPLHITDVVCDVNNLSPELIEHIQYDIGLNTVEHIAKKTDYDRWRELQEGIYQTTLDVVYDEVLENECVQLLITKTPGGRSKVDHQDKKSSKDIADAVANTIWYLESDDANPVGNWMPIGMGHIV